MIPKAELHVHLEGSAPPKLIKRIAERNGVTLPENIFKDENTYAFNDFLHFIEVYDQACAAIKTEQDYYDITFEYLKQSAAEGAIYVELTCSPDHGAMAGLNYNDFVNVITRAMTDAEQQFNIVSRIIMVCVRNLGVENCLNAAKQVVANPHPMVVGFGMAGDEINFPPAQFKEVFQIAFDAGLHCTTHAGEHAGPKDIREAIDTLPITRLGHGVRIFEDPELVQEIIKRNITLEVCPSSNIALFVYDDYASHPLRKLFDAGVKVTLNSDDPPYFATTLGREYTVAKEQFGFNDEQLRQLTRTAIENSFADVATKQQLLERV